MFSPAMTYTLFQKEKKIWEKPNLEMRLEMSSNVKNDIT